MIKKLIDRLVGHNFVNHGTFPARASQPARVVVMCTRCGISAVIPAVVKS